MSAERQPSNLIEEYAQRAVKIRELEEEAAALKTKNEEARETLLRVFEETGENSIKTVFGTVYLHRTVVLKLERGVEHVCKALKMMGLEKFVTERIANEKELARHIDEQNLADALADEVKIVELYHPRVRRPR
jgi:phage host-nuclease inhibitor protein Gam